MIGIGIGINRRRRGGPQIITAVIAPALAPLENGDTIDSGLSADIDQTSNYASTAGTISSVDVTATINSVSAELTDTVSYEDVVAVSVLVTDSESNTRTYSLARTVPAPAGNVLWGGEPATWGGSPATWGAT